jgi:hypothetical protein
MKGQASVATVLGCDWSALAIQRRRGRMRLRV